MLKNTSQKGFTIVELLIVIVVIGILAALVLNTFSGVQKRARDTERQTDINSIATQLEVYYNDNGYYPTLANLQDGASAGWVKTNLKGLDLKALIAPGVTPTAPATTSVNNSNTPTKDQYGYVPTAGCDNTATMCATYTLYWYSEDKSAVNSKASLN